MQTERNPASQQSVTHDNINGNEETSVNSPASYKGKNKKNQATERFLLFCVYRQSQGQVMGVMGSDDPKMS